MIKYFKEDNLFNKISFYEGIQDENSFNYDRLKKIIFYLSVFTSINMQ
jgi:hypothetical protein